MPFDPDAPLPQVTDLEQLSAQERMTLARQALYDLERMALQARGTYEILAFLLGVSADDVAEVQDRAEADDLAEVEADGRPAVGTDRRLAPKRPKEAERNLSGASESRYARLRRSEGQWRKGNVDSYSARALQSPGDPRRTRRPFSTAC